jgi:hypothetical protein
VEPSRSVLYGVLALAAISVVGGVISVAGDLSPNLLDALGPDGHLSIPLPMVAAQVVLAIAACSRRRWLALTGSGLLAAALFVCIISGFFDGGYADDRFGALERAYQLFLIAALATVGVLAAVRFRRALR